MPRWCGSSLTSCPATVAPEPYRLQLWGGLGLIVVDAGRRPTPVPYEPFHELFSVLRPSVEAMAELEAQGTPLDGLSSAEVEAAVGLR